MLSHLLRRVPLPQRQQRGPQHRVPLAVLRPRPHQLRAAESIVIYYMILYYTILYYIIVPARLPYCG